MKKLLLLLFTLLVSSCYTPSYTTMFDREDSDISKDHGEFTFTIFQTLDYGEALALTTDYKVVKVRTKKDVYYDGKKISGTFIRTGVYQYINKEGFMRTVPVFVALEEYSELTK